jgi:hypothetical protein
MRRLLENAVEKLLRRRGMIEDVGTCEQGEK